MGYLLCKGDYPPAPIVVSFVLGPIFETNFRRTGLIARAGIFGYLIGRPIAFAVVALITMTIFVRFARVLSRRTP